MAQFLFQFWSCADPLSQSPTQTQTQSKGKAKEEEGKPSKPSTENN